MIHGLKPTILMVIAETILGASNVLFKLASNDGSDLRILVAYRFLFAAAFMVPVALFLERSILHPLYTHVPWRTHHIYIYTNLCLKFIMVFLQKQEAKVDMEGDLAIAFICVGRVCYIDSLFSNFWNLFWFCYYILIWILGNIVRKHAKQ